jgi:hypothetical protein
MFLPWILSLLLYLGLTHTDPELVVRFYTGYSLAAFLSFSEFGSISMLMGAFAFQLNTAGAHTAPKTKKEIFWIPFLLVSLFIGLLLLTHFAAGIPVYLGALIISPMIFLLPFIYHVDRQPKPPAAASLLSIEEQCRIKDQAFSSDLIREFMHRYPHSSTYVYRSNKAHSAGGLFFHNKEILNFLNPAMLEVTLNCPFASKPGVLALGRETFCAYLSRDTSEGCTVSLLPHDNWEDWLIGLERKDWLDRIKELDTLPATHPPLRNRPFQFIEQIHQWEPFTLL